MGLMRLTFINIKRQLKNPFVIIITLLMPVVMLLIMNGGKGEGRDKIGAIGIVDKSNSIYSQEIIGELEKSYNITLIGDAEENLNLIRDNKVGAIYVIDSNFKEVLEQGNSPEVKCYSNGTSNGIILADEIITTYINNVVQESISEGLSTKSIKTIVNNEKVTDKSSYIMIVLMLCYFMMIGGSIISEEIIKLKEQNVLRRTIATANSDRAILGSLFMSSFIIQGALCSLGLLILISVLKPENANIAQGILAVVLGSLITTSLIVAVTRWIKNKTLASLAIVVIGLIAFVASMMQWGMDSIENVPIFIEGLSIISPFTWLLRIIDTGSIIMPCLVLILMSVVFFTAGSFRLRDFVKE